MAIGHRMIPCSFEGISFSLVLLYRSYRVCASMFLSDCHSQQPDLQPGPPCMSSLTLIDINCAP
jgi:hypothetical protein